MVKIEKGESNTIRQIYKAYEADAEHWDSAGIPVGIAGEECDRSLWYSLRWAMIPEPKGGRILRRFETGSREEARLISDLQRIGVSVTNRQQKIKLAGGHLRGKIDGRLTLLPEAPKTEHVLECKAVNLKAMRALRLHGAKKSQPKHFAQCQLAMHALGLTRAFYFVECTDDDSLFSERIEYDLHYSSYLVSRISRIVTDKRPPGRACKDENDFRARYCDHRAVCFGGELMRETCRSCIHSKPDLDADASWTCGRHSVSLSLDEQKAGCPQHRFIPETVPGIQIDVDRDTEIITYDMGDGIIWKNGE